MFKGVNKVLGLSCSVTDSSGETGLHASLFLLCWWGVRQCVVAVLFPLPYSTGIQEGSQRAAVHNCYMFSDLKQYKCAILQYWKPEVQNNSDQTKSRGFLL